MTTTPNLTVRPGVQPPPATELPTAPDVVPARYFSWKPLLSRTLGVLLLVPALPAIGFCVVIIRLTSPGPGIFRQTRVGLRGKHFTMYKLRTMRSDAESKSGAVWAQPNDPRITRIGYLFRKLHLDELPQLFNVVRGEMTLVGPRPERPEFVQKLVLEIPGYLNRLAVRPGVTGLAQINLPPDTTIDCVRRKLILDVEYIATANLWTDTRIFLCTFVRLIGIRGLLPARILGLYMTPVIDEQKTVAADVLPGLPPHFYHDSDEYVTTATQSRLVTTDLENTPATATSIKRPKQPR